MLGAGARDDRRRAGFDGVAYVQVLELEAGGQGRFLVQPRTQTLEVRIGVLNVLDGHMLCRLIGVVPGVLRFGQEVDPRCRGRLVLAGGIDAQDERGIVDALKLGVAVRGGVGKYQFDGERRAQVADGRDVVRTCGQHCGFAL